MPASNSRQGLTTSQRWSSKFAQVNCRDRTQGIATNKATAVVTKVPETRQDPVMGIRKKGDH